MAHVTKTSAKHARKTRVPLAHEQRARSANKNNIRERQIKEALERTKKKEDLHRSAAYISALNHLYLNIR